MSSTTANSTSNKKRRRQTNAAIVPLQSSSSSNTFPSYPIRNLTKLYCSTQTLRCATGHSNGALSPCISCAYKICNFDIALDVEFTRRVPNVRPEMCPRSLALRSGTVGFERDGTGYQRGMAVLTVGDGDFTFSLAVARLVMESDHDSSGSKLRGTVVASSYEDVHTLQNVYPNLDSTLEALHSYNVKVLYNVDATRLDATLPKTFQPPLVKYHRICWNFPCTAISNGQDGQNSAMEENKGLIRTFVKNALPYLEEDVGEIHMAHKTKPPYNQWNLEGVALEGMKSDDNPRGLEYKGRIVFDKSSFVPYTPRKALDRKSFPCHDACVYVFGWKKKGMDNSLRENGKEHVFHATIPQPKALEQSQYSVVPVTEFIIDELRNLHLQGSVVNRTGRFVKKQRSEITNNSHEKRMKI
ncbi:hypothetical protein ACHAW6_015835 [Cyclotella cf. meneghiniana]